MCAYGKSAIIASFSDLAKLHAFKTIQSVSVRVRQLCESHACWLWKALPWVLTTYCVADTFLMVCTCLMLMRLKETMSKKSSNKDKKNKPKGCNQSSMKNVTRKRYFEQSDKDEEHSNNDVMRKSQKRTVNTLRQQMANIWSQRTKNQ